MPIFPTLRKGRNHEVSGLRIETFKETNLKKLLTWTKTERELRMWAGETFSKIPDANAFRTHLKRPRVKSYQARDKWGRFIGYAELVELTKGSCTLCRVIIDPARRGMGSGKALVESLSRQAFEHLGYRRLLLNVFTFNVPAVRCYRSLGFRPLPKSPKPRSYRGQIWNLVIMEKQAPAKAA